MTRATVEANRLNEKAAGQHLETEVVLRGRSVRSLTQTIPLAEPEDRRGRGRYLVVKIPRETVQELKRRAQELPEDRRNDFVRRWMIRNKQAVLEQYLRLRDKSGRKTIKRFRHDVVPVRTERGPMVPSRREAAPAPSKTAASVPSRREQPTQAKAPPVLVRRAPRTEDRGRPTAASIGSLKISGPKEVSTGAPAEARVPKVRRRKQVYAKPSQVRGGYGTKEKPYRIRASSVRRARGKSIAATDVEVPFRINIGELGSIYFILELKANQLTTSSFNTTVTEVSRTVNTMMRRRAASSGQKVDMSATSRQVRKALDSAVRDLESHPKWGAKMATYLRGN
jgi:hypothetical protein